MKMKFKRIMRTAAAVLTVSAINIASTYTALPVSADDDLTIDEIRDKISQIEAENDARRDEINRLDEDIALEEENLKKTEALLVEQQNLVDYYNNLVYYKNCDIAEVEEQIAETEAQISGLSRQISEKERDIEHLEQQNADNLEKFAQIIRGMYVSGDSDMFGVISGSTDFYSLMVGTEIAGNITEKNLEFMNELKKDIETLSSDKKQLITDKEKLENIVIRLDSEKTTLYNEQAELEGLVYESSAAANQYAADYGNYQAAIAELENKQDNLNYEIAVSAAEIDSFEEQIREIIASQSKPEAVYQEGEWIWPVPGRSYISCGFGYDPYLDRIHKGIDIGDGGIYGDPIHASKAGTVIVADTSYIPGYSYGMYVVVDHGGGYTSTYAHMSEVAAYVGQEVAQGDILGYVGNTGYSFGPHLHFEIRINGEPQNPFGYVTMA